MILEEVPVVPLYHSRRSSESCTGLWHAIICTFLKIELLCMQVCLLHLGQSLEDMEQETFGWVDNKPQDLGHFDAPEDDE